MSAIRLPLVDKAAFWRLARLAYGHALCIATSRLHRLLLQYDDEYFSLSIAEV